MPTDEEMTAIVDEAASRGDFQLPPMLMATTEQQPRCAQAFVPSSTGRS
jgi:hypothetical protein